MIRMSSSQIGVAFVACMGLLTATASTQPKPPPGKKEQLNSTPKQNQDGLTPNTNLAPDLLNVLIKVRMKKMDP